MASNANTVKVTFLGDASSLAAAAKRASGSAADVGKQASRTGEVIRKSLLIVGVGAVAGLGAAFVSGFKDAASYQQITDQVAQTISSTGKAAGVTVEDLKKYAGQLESLSGVDEELILSGQNVLLTFTNIRNGVGEGNAIFDQASKAALNLSTTMGNDLVGANTLVGKALNDPIKGMTALSRAGVQLTAEQRETIKAMVASGDAMGAQKIILGELETQFGGAAEAAGKGFNGSMARLKDVVSDSFRTVAQKALPVLTDLADWLSAKIPVVVGHATTAFQKIRDWWNNNRDGIVSALTTVRDAMVKLADKVKAGAETIIDNWDDIKSTAEKAATVLSPIFAALIVHWAAVATAATISAGKQAAAWVVTKVAAAGAAIAHGVAVTVMVAGWVLMGAQALVNGAKIAAGWLLALGPIGLGIIAFAAIAAAIVFAWKKSETFRDIVKGAFVIALKAVDGFLWGIQKMLEALGKIPGFGWADTAAKKVAGARNAVKGLADNIAGLQDKTVTITTVQRTVIEAQKDGKGGGVQARAGGGPVLPGQPYLVGEEGPELIVPRRSGHVMTAKETAGLGGNTYNLVLSGEHSVSTSDVPSMFRRMELLAGS